MTKKILITGGAGFIGTHLINKLTNMGSWEIIVLDSLIDQVHPNGLWQKPDNVTFFHADIRDQEPVRQALTGVEYVVHLAAETGVGQSAYEIARYVGTNEYGTAVLLEEISKINQQIKSVVLASSRAVYGEGRYYCNVCGPVFPLGRSLKALNNAQWDHLCPECDTVLTVQPSMEHQPLSPSSVYAITKHNQEQLLTLFADTFNVPSTILRFQNVYGPGQSLSNPYTGILSLFSTRIKNGNPVFIYEDGLEQRDFVYVEDVVNSILLALSKPSSRGEIFNIGTGEGTTVMDIAKILNEKLGGTSDIQVTGQFRAGDIRHAIASLTNSENNLGYTPTTSIAEGLTKLSAWVNSQQVMTDTYLAMESEMKQKGIMG
ncbi:MAG: NAD-dependent epimerase/dehydratase family protein [Methyloprofundus sp.]|nr:NAD-dependent epimerase/dehydratase family protein [Methyloprofundus sp.]